jgi:hypothetical protein
MSALVPDADCSSAVLLRIYRSHLTTFIELYVLLSRHKAHTTILLRVLFGNIPKMDDTTCNAKTIDSLLEPCALLHSSGESRALSWRITQLRTLRQMIVNHKKEFLEALKLDLGKSYVSVLQT